MSVSRPTILQVIPRLEEGGAERTTIEIAEALVKAGARALVASDGGRLEGALRDAGGELVRLPVASKNPATIWLNAGRIAEIAKLEGVGLIHARSRAPAWSAYWASQRLTLPFVTTYHGAYAEVGPIKRAYNSVMAKGDRVIANSEYTAGLIRGRYGVPPERLVIIYRGIDPARFDFLAVSPERKATLRTRWGLAETDRVVLMVARLSELKGQRVVIEAARLLKERGDLAGVVIVLAGGSGHKADYADTLRAAVVQAGLQAHIRLPGPLDDVPAGYALSELGLCASIAPEGFGRTSVEAAAMGCPVIVSDIGGLPETIVAGPAPGFTGWRVPPASAVALADALSVALHLPAETRHGIGLRGRAFVTSRFLAGDLKRRTLGVYDQLLGTKLASQRLT
jgi:glycosyltransferase involved in cell wall biosynthesis